MDNNAAIASILGAAAAAASFFISSSHLLLVAAVDTPQRVLTPPPGDDELLRRYLEGQHEEIRRRRRRRRVNRPRHRPEPQLAYIPQLNWELADWTDEWIFKRLRFTRNDIHRLLPLLRIEIIEWSNRYKPSPEKAFVIFLYRMSWPHRIYDLIELFGCSRAQISSIFNDVAVHLHDEFKGLLLWDDRRLTHAQLSAYTGAIDRIGGGGQIWGWVDGTIIETTRPLDNQRLLYSGYKKCHGFKYQGVMTPDGLISSLFGPMVASRGDWYLFERSGVEGKVLRLYDRNGIEEGSEEWLFLYGDPAYCSSAITRGAYRRQPGRELTPLQQLFNYEMAKLRIAVEHGFGLVHNLWMKMGLEYTLRLGSSPVAAYFVSAVLMTNVWTCLKGNQVSVKFGVEPPSVEVYLGGELGGLVEEENEGVPTDR